VVEVSGDRSFCFSLFAFGSTCHFICIFVEASTVPVMSLLLKLLISASFSLKL